MHLDRAQARRLARVLLSQASVCRFRHNIKVIATELVRHHVGTEHFGKNPPVEDAARGWRGSVMASLVESDYIWRTPELKRCLAPLSYLYIRLNGDVFTCARNSWLKPIGNVFQQRLSDIIGGEKHLLLIDEARNEFDIHSPQWGRCKNCYMDFSREET